MRRWLAIACLCWTMRAESAGRRGFPSTIDRYDIILRRRPFATGTGAPVEPAPSSTADVPPAAAVLDGYDLRAISVGLGRASAGILSTAASPPRSFWLQVGEMQDGLELLEVDFEAGAVRVRKDGQEHWLHVGAGAVVVPSAPPALSPERIKTRPPDAHRIRRQREALRARREARDAEARDRLTPEEALRAEQMDRLRQGRAPLPIPLTPNMDAQLVSEGVLPPQEQPSGEPLVEDVEDP